MRSWHSFSLIGRILILLNFLFLLLALALSLLYFLPGNLNRWMASQQRNWEIQAELTGLSGRVQSAWDSELQWAEIELRQLAAQASQVFSHPDSFPLSAQPGEYDFDKDTGVYVSTKSEEPLSLVLSAASSLTPEILRDIRLAEYLGPPLKNLLESQPHFRRTFILTADSLFVSFPFLDFPKKIKEGKLKRDFQAREFIWYEKSRLEQNPGKKPLWVWDSSGLIGEPGSALCVLPFFSGDQFKGVALFEYQAMSAAHRLFGGPGFSENAILLLGEDQRLTGFNSKGAELLKLPLRTGKVEPPLPFKQLPTSSLSPILPQCLVHTGVVLSAGEFEGMSVRIERLNSSLVVFLPLKSSVGMLLPGHQANPNLKIAVFSLWLFATLCGGGNFLWIVFARKKLHQAPRQLAESMAALNGLEREKAVLKEQSGELGDVYQRFDVSLQRVRQALGSLQTDFPQEQSPRQPFSEAVGEIKLLSEQVRLLSCFTVSADLDTGLTHLSQLLCDYFGAARSLFLLYSPGEHLFQSFQSEFNGKSGENERISFPMMEGSFIEVVYNTRQPASAELSDLSPPDSGKFGRVVARNLLLAPLFFRKTVFGLVLLADREEGWTTDHSLHLAALEETLSRILNNLLQNERWRKIDLLRREYCVELAKAIEAPLNRIRNEVQAIHHRLGRLTPYYKEHCESILFETGILYQIAHEVREMEEKELLKEPSL